MKDIEPLKRAKVRQYRDEVAAVAATDPDIAAEAVDLIRVEYEPLPAVFDPVEALEPDAPIIHEFDAKGRPNTSNLLSCPGSWPAATWRRGGNSPAMWWRTSSGPPGSTTAAWGSRAAWPSSTSTTT